ncbi:hypothetical protein TNCV_1601421 [Trichonephila clavipes]|nr:hypothetical protein TNCV_1601421 [Trichonephila clavipes]
MARNAHLQPAGLLWEEGKFVEPFIITEKTCHTRESEPTTTKEVPEERQSYEHLRYWRHINPFFPPKQILVHTAGIFNLANVHDLERAEVHWQMYQSGVKSDAKTSVFNPQASSVLLYRPNKRDERMSRPSRHRGLNLGPMVFKCNSLQLTTVLDIA